MESAEKVRMVLARVDRGWTYRQQDLLDALTEELQKATEALVLVDESAIPTDPIDPPQSKPDEPIESTPEQTEKSETLNPSNSQKQTSVSSSVSGENTKIAPSTGDGGVLAWASFSLLAGGLWMGMQSLKKRR